MDSRDSSIYRKYVQEIDELIKQIIKTNFLSDQIYTQIKSKIGAFDQMLERHATPDEDSGFLTWSKSRLHKISNVLIEAQTKPNKISHESQEDLMHPTGDYYNEDTSIKLSDKIKDELVNILEDKYIEQK